MRAAVRSVGVVSAIAAATVLSPSGIGAAAVSAPVPEIAALAPAAHATVGVAHPITVTFRAPVADRAAAERRLAVRTSPPMTGSYQWVDDHVVQWTPDHYWPAHRTIALSVGRVATDFQTGPAVVGVASISAHTFTVSIDGVPADPLPAPHHRPHFGEEGVLPATMGRAEYPTPTGHYTVLAKDASVLMDSSSVGIPVDDPDGYRFDVQHAVRITARGLYVHSAPWALRSLGVENISHGCVGLSPTDAEWYFDRVNVGDPVIIEE